MHMDLENISKTISGLHTEGKKRYIPRGMLDRLAPEIYQAVKDGVSMNQVRIALENEHGIKVTVRSIAVCLRRNKLVPERKGHNTHNVCYI